MIHSHVKGCTMSIEPYTATATQWDRVTGVAVEPTGCFLTCLQTADTAFLLHS